VVIFDWDDFEARWYIRSQIEEGDTSTANINEPASGHNIWRYYDYIERHGNHEDKMILKGLSVLRGVYMTPIFELLQFTGIMLPDCVVSYQAANLDITFIPADSGSQDKLVLRRDGWEFDVTVWKEGK
jgi:hypothetical protein